MYKLTNDICNIVNEIEIKYNNFDFEFNVYYQETTALINLCYKNKLIYIFNNDSQNHIDKSNYEKIKTVVTTIINLKTLNLLN